MPSPFHLDARAYELSQVFRVCAYTFQVGGAWTGQDYDLELEHDLAKDYFVLLQPTTDTTGNAGPAATACRLTHDPHGTGDLAVSAGARILRLHREGSASAWLGTITVVECLQPAHPSGFTLLGVTVANLGPGAPGVTEVAVASGVAYSARTVPFGGLWAGGMSSTETGADRWPTVICRVVYGADSVIRIRRDNKGTGTVQNAAATVHLVQWGQDWTVQVASIQPSSAVGGADLNLVGEFQAAAISPVVRARSWFFGTATASETAPNGLVLATLGDGVNELTTEAQVAAGSWAASKFEAECWVLTHNALSVDWQRIASTSTVAPLGMATTQHRDLEGYRSIGEPTLTSGRRALVLGFSAGAATDGQHSEAMLYAKLTGRTLVEVWRRDNTINNVVGWLQVIDFGSIHSAIETIESPGPIQGILLPDLELTAGAISVVSSRSAFRLGSVAPDSDNAGRMYGFHSGDPTSDATLRYRITAHGDLGQAGWVWQEKGAGRWLGWNAYNFMHGSHLINGQTAARYGLVACYSSIYDRVIAGYLSSTSSTLLNLSYLDQDGDPFSYVTLTGLELLNTFTGPVLGDDAIIRAIELDDGSIRLAVLVRDEDGLWDFNIYSSVDGAASWSLIASRIIWRATSGTALSAQPVTAAFASSGDWLRLVWVDATDAKVLTAVSSSRGSSWDYIGSGLPPIYTSDNGASFDSYAIALAARPDGAGTFMLWVRGLLFSYVVSGYTATRLDAWVSDADFGINLGSGSEVERMSAAYTPDGIFLALQVDVAASSQTSLRLRVYDVDDPQGVQRTIGVRSIFGPGVQIKPYQLHLLNGGRELLVAANAVSFAGSTVAGISLARLGGWSELPVQGQAASGAVALQTWSSLWSDSPSSGAYAVWPLIQSGGTITPSRSNLEVQTSAGQHAYWEFSPSSTGYWNNLGPHRGLSFGGLIRVPSAAGDVAGSNIGVKVRAQGAGASGVSFMLTATTTQISVWDLLAGTKVASIPAPTLATSWWEIRGGLTENFDVFAAARPYEGSTWKGRSEWTTVAGLLVGGAGITLDLLHVGHQAYSGSGTNESEWREFWVSDSYGVNLQRDGADWSVMRGRTTTSRAQRIFSGVDVFWGGSAAARGDSFTGEVGSAHPPEAIFLDSPRLTWEAADDGAQSLTFDFGAGSVADAPARRSLHEGIMLVGSRSRTATVEYDVDGTWSSPIATFTADATMQGSLRVISVDGHAALVEYPDLPDSAGSLAGAYLRVTAASSSAANNKTWRVRKHGSATQEGGMNRAWVYLESSVNTRALANYGVMAGDTVCAFGDRMAVVYGRPVKTRYMRLSFPSEEVIDGKHALGGLIAGPIHQFDPPLDWAWKDNDQPNTTRFSSRSGITWAKSEGPAQRTWQARLVGDQQQRSREGYRDLLRLFASYDVRPVGLLTQISGSRPLPAACVYGYITSGGQLDNEGWWRDSDGVWRSAGDLSLQLQEVV